MIGHLFRQLRSVVVLGLLGLLACAACGVASAADWVRLSEGSPLSRKDYAWAHDSDRGVLVLYGGNGHDGVVYGDTWEFDGNDWRLMAPPVSPGLRQDHAMAYDPVRRRVVLFGGDQPGPVLPDNQTWEYDGNTWQQVLPALSPPPREEHRIAFHAGLGEVVLYGGLDDLGLFLLGDTWSWDGVRWAPLAPAASPIARSKHALASHPPSGGVLLFAGDTLLGAGGDEATTWLFDGATWQQLFPAVSPSPRDLPDMAWDETLGRMVLFGGDPSGPGLPPLGDTWTFDGTTWSEVLPLLSPPARRAHHLAPDPRGIGTLMFGGEVLESGAALTTIEGPDFWRFDGASWSEVVTGTPPPRWGAAMAYDADRDRMVLYGGKDLVGHRDDTWEFTPAGLWQSVAAEQPRPSPQSGHESGMSSSRGSALALALFAAFVPCLFISM